MVLFVTTRTKLVRTVVKLVIASMTAQSNAISLRISSAVSVVMQVIWPEIAQTDHVVQTGVTMFLVVQMAHQQAALVLEMPLTGNTR
jgi:hypothetical protein